MPMRNPGTGGRRGYCSRRFESVKPAAGAAAPVGRRLPV